MNRERGAAIIAGFVLWALCSASYAGYLTLERGLMHDTSCPFTEASSNYGEATWSWFPPGLTCTWRGVSYNGSEYVFVQSPPPSRAVLGVVLLAWAGTLAAVAWTSRRVRDVHGRG
jgi:drug/metabolite transporter (DMT)-like permease